MRLTSDAHCTRLANYVLERRTVAEIRRKIIEKGGRGLLSRLFRAKNDKEDIAAWKLDLNRILHAFNVRSLPFTRLLLTVPLQTELVINTHVVVSDIHRDVSRVRGEVGSQVHSVSTVTFDPSKTGGCLQFPSPKPG